MFFQCALAKKVPEMYGRKDGGSERLCTSLIYLYNPSFIFQVIIVHP